ncbi:MAG TPA: AAA family ATPase [Bradyrhizobium sp.]|nr:AAA family ATPase [Bradyrhizobium sp.]
MTGSGTDDVTMQEKVFAFLGDARHHAGVQRIDTHAASVFLADDRALKIKRAIRFPFLDYSTLDKRKAACEEEIKVNRPFAPQIYRRVVPITQAADGQLSVDGPGTPVEYAVEMTRFDERKTVDHLARDGALDGRLVDAMADAIAAAHRVAPAVPADPWLQSVPKLIDDNSTAMRAAGGFAADDIDELGTASHAAFSRLRPLLEQRGRTGFVRRCHGDLHLANIVVIDEKPVLFDAIEFDEKIASIDVLYDLAFVLMDLLHYGQQAAANALLNRYLSVTGRENLEALATLPLLMSIRAAIRAQVLLARAHRTGADGTGASRDARAYFDLAKRLIHPRRPILVALGGLSGTGKSAVARAIASDLPPEPGAIILRSDVLRKQMFGVGLEEKLPESAYGPEVGHQVYETLTRQAGGVLSQGHSVIADAVFARASERAAILDVAWRSHIRFIGLFLVADLETRQKRISRRMRDASDATIEIARLQEDYDVGAIDWAIIDASGTLEETVSACRSRIAAFEAD